MKGILVPSIGTFMYTDLPDPVPEPGMVVVRVTVTGLCRTDLKIIRSGHRDLVLPRVPGEEVVGVIAQVGAEVEGWEPGERVYVYPGQWCGACSFCLHGAENLCRSMQIMGFHRDGGFAEQVTVPAQSLMRIPEGVPDEIAIFAEPLSCCLNALELSCIREGEKIGIWGAGTAGMLLRRAAQTMGAIPFSFDPDPVRADRANGTATPEEDMFFDVCVVAVGNRDAYEAALSRLAPRGRLVVFSGLLAGQDTFPVSFNQLHYHEQTLVGAYGCAPRHSGWALDLLASGAVRVDDLVTHHLPLERLDTALDLVANRSGLKILLSVESST